LKSPRLTSKEFRYVEARDLLEQARFQLRNHILQRPLSVVSQIHENRDPCRELNELLLYSFSCSVSSFLSFDDNSSSLATLRGFCKTIEQRKLHNSDEALAYWLKIFANSIYGFFVELNPDIKNKNVPVNVFSGEKHFLDHSDVIEKAGR
jgi:hypothetical protein